MGARGHLGTGSRCGRQSPPGVAIATVCAIANELGSPLAEVLDETSASILVYQQGVAARRGALAGPRMSARVLMWLPLGTCALGALFGASPWRVLLDGGIGTLSLMAGLLAMLIGRAWVARLVARATTPGGPVRGTGPP